MATTVPQGSILSAPPYPKSPAKSLVAVPSRRRRQVDRESGRALEILGHAIEYLADEYALECMDSNSRSKSSSNPRVEAIELLKKLNRDIYMNCPLIPTFSERLMRVWKLQRA